jgi:hypothetical protein
MNDSNAVIVRLLLSGQAERATFLRLSACVRAGGVVVLVSGQTSRKVDAGSVTNDAAPKIYPQVERHRSRTFASCGGLAAAVKQVVAGIPQVSAPASFGAETLATVLHITDEKV